MVFPYLHIMYIDQIHSLFYSFFNPPPCPPLLKFLVGFIMLISYMHIMYFDKIQSISPSLLLSFSLVPTPTIPLLQYVILLFF
jgi:hypothetical protein